MPNGMRGGRRRCGRCRRRDRMRFVSTDIVDNLRRVGARVDLRIDLKDASVFTDNVGDAAVESEYRYPVFGAVGSGDFLVGIEQQRKRQAVFLRKSAMGVGAIDAAAKERDTPTLQLRVAVAKGACLLGAAGVLSLG